LHPRLQGAFLVALTSPATYRLLRELGIVRGPWPVKWARAAVHAGADLLLFTSADDARRAIRALVPSLAGASSTTPSDGSSASANRSA
jgi:hypothetical protein